MRDTLRRCAALLLTAALLLVATTGFASAVSQDEWSAAVAADAESFSETEGLSDEWWNVLLLGCDSYTKNDYQRTDSMIIVSINAAKGQVKLTSLMRDTWIPVPGSKKHRKLTELCAVGGPELTIRAINESFGMDISDYALISMEGIAEIIDLLGGVEVDVTEEELSLIHI